MNLIQPWLVDSAASCPNHLYVSVCLIKEMFTKGSGDRCYVCCAIRSELECGLDDDVYEPFFLRRWSGVTGWLAVGGCQGHFYAPSTQKQTQTDTPPPPPHTPVFLTPHPVAPQTNCHLLDISHCSSWNDRATSLNKPWLPPRSHDGRLSTKVENFSEVHVSHTCVNHNIASSSEFIWGYITASCKLWRPGPCVLFTGGGRVQFIYYV